ncbi:MAG: zf-HC2 domain-containing protein, partial [Burkholderiaceae bacterium]|nr:zf-HC2 domain-containing protein [Burkholderiaceae bacterium]
MNCARIAPLLDAHLDGELPAATVQQVEDHLRACARCRASVQRLRALRQLLQEAARDTAAPPALRQRLLTAVESPVPAPPSARPLWLAAAPGLAALALASYLLFARTASTGTTPPADRFVYHVASSAHAAAVLRTLKNHLDATPSIRVVVVAHNDGIDFLLRGARDDTGAPFALAVHELRQRGVDFRVCGNTLTRRRLPAEAVLPEAALVPSG